MELGIIGIGNMGEAILRGIIAKQIIVPNKIGIFDINQEKVERLSDELGIQCFQTVKELLQSVDNIVLAVKPNVCESLLGEQKADFENKVLYSIVTGWSRNRIQAILPETCRILRIMPNTPCLVGEGMIVFDSDHTLTKDELCFAETIFSSIGVVEQVPSYLMDAVTGVSGSGPAYVYIFIEAMADAGVRAGLPRELAYRLASQTVLGSAKTVLETGEHPGSLKDAVCSPGGTTIEAVSVLEKDGFRFALMDAIEACINKAKKLSQ